MASFFETMRGAAAALGDDTPIMTGIDEPLLTGNRDGALLLGSRLPLPAAARRLPVAKRPPYDLDFIWHKGKEHGVTFGGTGAGKFTAAIAVNLLNYPAGAFVIDPKGEIFAVTHEAMATVSPSRLWTKNHVLDPFQEVRIIGDDGAWTAPQSASYNPLDVVRSNPDDAYSDAREIVGAIFTPTQGREDFFNKMAEGFLTAVIMLVCCNPAYAERRNLVTVRELFSDMAALLDLMELSPTPQVSAAAGRFKAYADNTRTSIFAELDKQTDFLDDAHLRSVLRESSFSFDDLFKEGSRVFVVLPANKLEGVWPLWLKLMMNCSLLVATRYKEAPDRPRVLWIVDEARQLGVMPALPRAYRLLRGYGVRVWSFWQTLGDLQGTYPDDWTAFIGNSMVQLLSCGETKEADYFAAMGGEHLVARQSHSQQDWVELHGLEHVVHRVARGFGRRSPYSVRGGSTSTSGQWEPVMRGENITQMPPDMQLVRLPGQAPQFCYKVHYYDVALCMTFARPNPYHHAAARASVTR